MVIKKFSSLIAGDKIALKKVACLASQNKKDFPNIAHPPLPVLQSTPPVSA